jgi:putative Holliday junction resolvase
MRIIGLDWGTRRLGFAASDPDGILSLPLEAIEVRDPKHTIEVVKVVCDRESADMLVVGMPFNMDGSSGEMVAHVEAFIEKMREVVSIPIETWDERLTTMGVENAMRRDNVKSDKRKKLRDKLAAQAILQGYLDSRIDIE